MLHLLKHIGFTATVAGSGEQALDIVKDRTDLDVIFMDIFMPGMNGIETTRRIQMMPLSGNRPLIVACTADSTEKTIQECISIGL